MTNARPFKPLSKKDEDEKPLQTPVFAVKYNMGICAAAFIPEREAFERDPRNRRRGNGIFNGKKRYACKGSRKSAVQAECSGAGIHNFPHRRSRNFFAEPKDADELCAMLSAARSCDYPVYIIGNGSNLLVSDSGVEALFIRIGARMAGIGFDGTRLKCGAGALLCTAAKAAVAEGLSGLEWAAGIPGTVGGAVAMNAGAYGGEIKQVLKSVTVVECGRIAKKIVHAGDLGYRSSVYAFPNAVVAGAEFELAVDADREARRRMEEFNMRRKEKQPLEYPSAGSTFKRPEGHFAGALIEQAGLKGTRIGGAEVSPKHAGFIVNCGGATCADVLNLIDLVRERVYKEFGVLLEPEIKIIK